VNDESEGIDLAVLQWELRKEAALSSIVEQQKDKEAVEAENAANYAKLLENIAHVRAFPPSHFPAMLSLFQVHLHVLHCLHECITSGVQEVQAWYTRADHSQ